MRIQINHKPIETKEFKNAPPGLHLGRLYKLIDLGTQIGEWQGKVTNTRKIVFFFELHGEDDTGMPLIEENGKPLVVNKYYNSTLNDKSTLYKHLVSWLNIDFSKLDDFEISDLLGRYAMVNIINYKNKDGKIKASIDNLTAVPNIVAKHGLPEGVNDLFYFDLDKFDSEKFNSLPDGYKKMIVESPEYRKLTGQSKKPVVQDDMPEDDIPF